MKKIFISIFTLLALLAMPQDASAQGFLNRVREKARQVVAGSASSSKQQEASAQESSSQAPQVSAAPAASLTRQNTGSQLSDYDKARAASESQRQYQHVGKWDDALVTPSTARTPMDLLKELPQLPSASQIANPTEDAQKSYYMAIQKVALRASQLNKDETCDKESLALFEKNLAAKYKEAYGLTDRECDIVMGKIEVSQQEQEKVFEKIMNFSMDELSALQQQFGGMTEKEQEAFAQQQAAQMMGGNVDAAYQVYKKYEADLRRYTGKTPEDMSRMMNESMSLEMAGKEKQAEELTDKMMAEVMAFQKNLSPDDQKKAAEFQSKVQREVQTAMMNASRNASPLGNLMAKAEENAKKGASIQEFMQKNQTYTTRLSEIMYNHQVSNSGEDFSAADRKRMDDLMNRIYASDDPDVYNPLYLEAGQLIASYRQRASEAWRKDLSQALDNIRSSMSQVIDLNRQAISDGLIPECMLYRFPLNLVLDACNILEGAYADMPNGNSPVYKSEPVLNLRLEEGEEFWWPEFYVDESVDDVLSGKNIFKRDNDGICQYSGGGWGVVNYDVNDRQLKGKEKMKSQKWTSKDGKRTVTYVAEGGYLILPEGDIIEPRAVELKGNNLIWADTIEQRDDNGRVTIQVVKYTYKL